MTNYTPQVGDVVRMGWPNNKAIQRPVYLVVQTDYIHPMIKAGSPLSPYQKQQYEQINTVIVQIFNGSGKPVNSSREVPCTSKNLVPAYIKLEKDIEIWEDRINFAKDFLSNIKNFEDDQKLYLLQGGHGNHRARRSNLRSRKATSNGAGVVSILKQGIGEVS